jgi:hypothetical protein
MEKLVTTDGGKLGLGLGGCMRALVRCSGSRKNTVGWWEQISADDGAHMKAENRDLHVPGLTVGTELLQALLEIGDGPLSAEMELLAPFLQLGLPHVRAKGMV